MGVLAARLPAACLRAGMFLWSVSAAVAVKDHRTRSSDPSCYGCFHRRHCGRGPASHTRPCRENAEGACCALPCCCTTRRVRQRIANLPAGIRHVVVLASVPIIYPHVPVLESAAKYLSGAKVSILLMTSKCGSTHRLGSCAVSGWRCDEHGSRAF